MTGESEAAAGDAHAAADGALQAVPAVETLELGGGPDRSPSRRRRLPRHAIIAGVDVGGLDRDVAEQRLRSELGPRSVKATPVRIGSASVEVMPSAAGLSVDYAASIDGCRLDTA